MSESDDNQKLNTLRAEVWQRTREVTTSRITVLEQALGAFDRGLLTMEQRNAAAGEAHKLAGSLGTFGFLEAGQLAREIEQLLKQADDLSATEGDRLAKLLPQLRQQISNSAENLRGNSSE